MKEARNAQGELRDSTVCKNFTTSEVSVVATMNIRPALCSLHCEQRR
jgi:hypothetical protein